MIKKICEDCGKERLLKNKTKDTLCRSCAVKWWHNNNPGMLKGDKNPNWKGGIQRPRTDGYIAIRLEEDDFFYPMSSKLSHSRGGRIMEHRLVMAKHLNRCLLPWEIVHHKNGNRADNRIDNLELFPAQTKHYVITRMAAYIKKLEKEVERLKDLIELDSSPHGMVTLATA